MTIMFGNLVYAGLTGLVILLSGDAVSTGTAAGFCAVTLWWFLGYARNRFYRNRLLFQALVSSPPADGEQRPT